MKRRSFKILLVTLAMLLVVLDYLTKQWAQSALAHGQTIALVGDFLSLKLLYNSGAAFSLGSSTTWIFTIFAAAVVVALPILILRIPLRSLQVILTVIWSGACGNLLDRLFRAPGFGTGHVVDFIKYNDWFVGNVADIWLVAGVIALIAWQLFGVDEADQVTAAEAEGVVGQVTAGAMEKTHDDA